ncbi:uncharacterized protein N7473_004902 [Penicillium subrubescens]|uniref:uncharacterized protein n=1 Tax=Penicillium subrubescens TaxID=1316194 RepID=UPI00254566D0|nr:uncharacterized protein N7473_004902 [Penicillium subrubescens]KAJ5900832.1 hypothetical protein N7473_004902 [Penicillium subrubescens]
MDFTMHGEEVALPSQQTDAADDATRPPDFYFEPSEMPAFDERLEIMSTLMTTLLEHGADPYALFRQPMYRYESIPVFPGDVKHPEYDDDDTDLRSSTFARLGIFANTLEQEYERIGILGETQEADICHPYEFDDAFKEAIHYVPENPPKYGVCSTLHCLLEDGGLCQPIFDFLGDSLDLKRRDPQDRTLFLAACRSIIGLDAAVDGPKANLYVSGGLPSLYPELDKPWQVEQQQKFPSICTRPIYTRPTLLEFFIFRGADLLAVDKYGQNEHTISSPYMTNANSS